MSTITTPDRFTTLPDERMIAATATALAEHGFTAEVVDDLDAACKAVLDRVPHGASVAYGQHSSMGKITEIHQELPGRIHIVLIRQPVGY